MSKELCDDGPLGLSTNELHSGYMIDACERKGARNPCNHLILLVGLRGVEPRTNGL